MNPGLALIAIALLLCSPASARNASVTECGTGPNVHAIERFLHHHSRMRRVAESGSIQSLGMPSAANNYDVDGVAVINDSDGVISRRNPFSLDKTTVRFTPVSAGGYRIDNPAAGDASTVDATPLSGLGDDDSRSVQLPFVFPFYGVNYSAVFVNSDGNLTFVEGDHASSDRSVARFDAGPPRIAALFSDLDPSRPGAAVSILTSDSRVTINWDAVPIYTDSGVGARQTFQVRLYADGAVEFAYTNIAISGSSAVVGITPGRLSTTTELLPLLGSVGHETTTGIAEFFSDVDQLDIAAAAQKFYATHEDSYDYLFIFNAVHLYINNGSIVAFEDTVRNSVQGYGIGPVDDGMIFGSPRRLQAVMNMGPMEQYPLDPYAPIPVRASAGDTGLSVLGHEAGHRFLAWTSVRDEAGLGIMWGRSNAHWSFNLNSEASLDEGNRIRDDGAGARPRFTTVATAEGYAPLDQYLFGFRAPEDVAPVFAALDTDGPANASPPHVGSSFNGRRYDIAIQDVIAEAGRRVPDSGIAQRNYRFAFVLVQSATTPLAADPLDLCARYKAQWTSYWNLITGGRSTADVRPARALNVSFWPHAELALGSAVTATVSITEPLDHDLAIAFEAPAGVVTSSSIVLKAGSTAAQFTLRALREGLEQVTLRPEDGAFEVVQAKIRVNP